MSNSNLVLVQSHVAVIAFRRLADKHARCAEQVIDRSKAQAHSKAADWYEQEAQYAEQAPSHMRIRVQVEELNQDELADAIQVPNFHFPINAE